MRVFKSDGKCRSIRREPVCRGRHRWLFLWLLTTAVLMVCGSTIVEGTATTDATNSDRQRLVYHIVKAATTPQSTWKRCDACRECCRPMPPRTNRTASRWAFSVTTWKPMFWRRWTVSARYGFFSEKWADVPVVDDAMLFYYGVGAVQELAQRIEEVASVLHSGNSAEAARLFLWVLWNSFLLKKEKKGHANKNKKRAKSTS